MSFVYTYMSIKGAVGTAVSDVVTAAQIAAGLERQSTESYNRKKEVSRLETMDGSLSVAVTSLCWLLCRHLKEFMRLKTLDGCHYNSLSNIKVKMVLLGREYTYFAR